MEYFPELENLQKIAYVIAIPLFALIIFYLMSQAITSITIIICIIAIIGLIAKTALTIYSPDKKINVGI